MKTVGYLRVSTKEQAKNSKFGIPNQRDIVEKYAEREDLEVSEWFSDDGYSGGNQMRPALQDLLALAKEEKITVIVAYFDRWARDTFLHLFLEKELIANKCHLISATEENLNDTSPHAELMKNMTIAFAQYERQRITARMTGGRRQKAKSGKVATGRTPFGYRKGDDGELEIDPEEAKVVVKIFNGRNKYGYSLRSIADGLNKKGHQTKSGKKWSAASVSYILKNDKYKGELNQMVGGDLISSTNQGLQVV